MTAALLPVLTPAQARARTLKRHWHTLHELQSIRGRELLTTPGVRRGLPEINHQTLSGDPTWSALMAAILALELQIAALDPNVWNHAIPAGHQL